MNLTPTGLPAQEDSIIVPFRHLPAGRTTIALKNKVEKNILIRTWGGIGDQICSEPTLRFALKNFKSGERITLASEMPELFRHLNFFDVYDLKKERPVWDDFLCFETIVNHDGNSLVPQFMSHSITNCVDFPSLCAFRCQLPIADKEVVLKPECPENPELISLANDQRHVLVHAGKHWPSKTFPKEWWDSALDSIKKQGLVPVLVGKETDETQGTVDTDTAGCVDLRNKTTVMETVWLSQKLKLVVTNDSSVLHMAVSGDAWIAFFASAKHPDYISHWRNGTWSWRMQNLSLGGMWNIMDNCPNRSGETRIDQVDEATLRSWLPDPEIVGPWCRERL
jgi:hypothetical protein